MDRIPVFNGEYEQISTSLTCGQFLNMIENVAVEQKLTDLQILELCLSKVSGKVLDYWLNLDSDSVDRKSWTLQKNTLMTEFGTKLGIKEKVEIRKNLQQNQTESVEDFYDRCVHAQYLVSNDVRDETFDREVLLHFLVGLLPSIRDLVLSQAACQNTPQDYIQQAKTHFQKIMVKNEPVDAFDGDDVKMEDDGSILYDDYELLDDHVKSEEQRFYENYDSFEPNIQLDELPLLADESGPTQMSSSSSGTGSSGLSCYMCSKKFKTRKKLNSHYKNKHGKSCLKCDYCEKVFLDKLRLSQHIGKTHKDFIPEKEVKCHYCPEIFRTAKLRSKHETESHSDLRRICDICQVECRDIKFLANHIALKHCLKNTKKQSICMYCNVFKRREIRNLRYHILTAHFNEADHKCHICGKGYMIQSELQKHISMNHLDERPYQCDQCPNSYKSQSGLEQHIITKHGEIEELPCPNEGCDRLFQNKVQLTAHVYQIHTKIKEKVQCSECGKEFQNPENLTRHHLSEHASDVEKDKLRLPCPDKDCSYSSFFKADLKKHYSKIHLKLKNYQCHMCEKTFTTKGRCNEHINGIHLNIKPYICDKCDYQTAYSGTFREHQKVAHGTQKYECKLCNHVARYKGNLDKHVRNVHQKQALKMM